MSHRCEYPEVEIEQSDEQGILVAGMKVLIPCPGCGETPLDGLSVIQAHAQEMQASLIAHQPHVPVYHWSPRARRKQIIRHGLRPSMRRTTTSAGGKNPPYVCFADSPSWAWALSGGMRWTPAGDWDLWQTWLNKLTDPTVLPTPDRPSGIYEVRAKHRVYKRDLWLVGSRTK